jgi:hypothetical protein
MHRNSIVTPLPGFAAVRAGVTEPKKAPANMHAVARLENNGTDMLAAQRDGLRAICPSPHSKRTKPSIVT